MFWLGSYYKSDPLTIDSTHVLYRVFIEVETFRSGEYEITTPNPNSELED